MRAPAYTSPILWVLFSTFLWTVVFAALKIIDASISVFQLMLLRYLGAFLTIALILSFKGGIRTYLSARPVSHFLRATTGVGGAVAITWASSRMPLVDATAIGLLYGVFAMALGAIFLKERVSFPQLISVCVVLSGVALVMLARGAFQQGVYAFAAIIAVLGAVSFAIEGVLIALLGRRETAWTVMLYVTVYGFLIMAPLAWIYWQAMPLQVAIFCMLLGPVSLLAQYGTIRGYREAPLTVVAPIDYAWIVFSVLLGVLIFGEIPGLLTFVGCLVILIGGAILTVVRSR
ncbi:MAG: DMT family transporter [Pseudomonadota bacterium]